MSTCVSCSFDFTTDVDDLIVRSTSWISALAQAVFDHAVQLHPFNQAHRNNIEALRRLRAESLPQRP